MTVQQRFQEALDALVEKLQRDPYVLAAVLVGSLSYDTVWEKSDIDLFVVAQEGKHRERSFSLVERDVNIHAYLVTRSEFRKALEGAVGSSFMHSIFSKGRMLFTKDETLAELYEGRHGLGDRDRQISLLSRTSWLLPSLTKAEKWLRVRGDAVYSFYWVMKCLDDLAAVEVILNGEVPTREVVQQALRCNPEFFGRVYTDFISAEKTPESVRTVLDGINGYLAERVPVLFRPLMDYLAESGGIRSMTEINHYFANQMNLRGVDSACEWLADEGIIRRLSAPVRLTEKSRVDVEEAAYYYQP